jgi:hypothetical protein
MKELPLAARFFILLVFGLGIAAVVASLPVLFQAQTNFLIVLGVAVIIAGLDL